jgi:GTP-binding protein HflX
VDPDQPHAPAVFADTVGFIRKLPHHLVSSFRSTLGEIVDADLVLHVIDRSHPGWEEQMEIAEEVLGDLGVDKGRVLRVYNKVDRLSGNGWSGDGHGAEVSGGGEAVTGDPADRGDDASAEDESRWMAGMGDSGVWVSALTGEGVDRLRAAIGQRLGGAHPS